MDTYFKINRTLLQKLEDTNFIVPETELLKGSSLELFEQQYKTTEDLERVFLPVQGTMAAVRNPNGVLIAFGDTKGKKYVTTSEIEGLIKKILEEDVTTAYFIVNGPIFSVARTRLTQLENHKRVVVFTHEELTFNSTRNSRVPIHELVTPTQTNGWLKATGLKKSQLPRIYETDPQIKYLDGLSGDVVIVWRSSPTVGIFPHHVTVTRSLVK